MFKLLRRSKHHVFLCQFIFCFLCGEVYYAQCAEWRDCRNSPLYISYYIPSTRVAYEYPTDPDIPTSEQTEPEMTKPVTKPIESEKDIRRHPKKIIDIDLCFLTQCHDWVVECRWFCDSIQEDSDFEKCEECLTPRGRHCLRCFKKY